MPLGIFAAIEDKAEGVTVSPPLSEYEVEPGESITKTIKLTNPIDKQVTLYLSAFDFRARSETGEPDFLQPTSEERSYSLASWITFSKSFVILEPEEVEAFVYTINVPQDAEPGGHYGVVFFSTKAPEIEGEQSQVVISSMVGSLILVKVPGFIVENGKVEEFSAPWFSTKAPIDFITRIANLGNIHFRPQGTIEIKNWRGKSVDTISINETNGNVLPESIRRFEESWNPESSFFGPIGMYKAELSLTYGESQKGLTETVIFWVIPIWLIILIIVLVVLILAWIIWKRRDNKKARIKDIVKEKEHLSPPKLPKKRVIIR